MKKDDEQRKFPDVRFTSAQLSIEFKWIRGEEVGQRGEKLDDKKWHKRILANTKLGKSDDLIEQIKGELRDEKDCLNIFSCTCQHLVYLVAITDFHDDVTKKKTLDLNKFCNYFYEKICQKALEDKNLLDFEKEKGFDLIMLDLESKMIAHRSKTQS